MFAIFVSNIFHKVTVFFMKCSFLVYLVKMQNAKYKSQITKRFLLKINENKFVLILIFIKQTVS